MNKQEATSKCVMATTNSRQRGGEMVGTLGRRFTPGRDTYNLGMNELAPRALFPGSFDPPTLGHLDLIQRGVHLFGSLVVAVAENPNKKALFSAEERVDFLRTMCADLPVEVLAFTGLVVDLAQERSCSVLLRGLRSVTDFEFEAPMAQTNRRLAPQVESVFVMPSHDHAFVSSRLVREVYGAGGSLPEVLHPAVDQALRQRS